MPAVSASLAFLQTRRELVGQCSRRCLSCRENRTAWHAVELKATRTCTGVDVCANLRRSSRELRPPGARGLVDGRHGRLARSLPLSNDPLELLRPADGGRRECRRRVGVAQPHVHLRLRYTTVSTGVVFLFFGALEGRRIISTYYVKRQWMCLTIG